MTATPAQLQTPVPAHRVQNLQARADKLSAAELIEESSELFGDRLVLSTSFGIQSAVMLHLATTVVPRIPVIWIDTGYLFPETYRFAEELSQRLDLNLHIFQPEMSSARMEALLGQPWSGGHRESLDRYDRIRKIEPMQRALRELRVHAWMAGLRAVQTRHRSRLGKVESYEHYYKIHPILPWSEEDVDQYLKKHDLPYHPLRQKGYASVGDWHSSRPLAKDDTTPRDTRYNGLKQECGIHLPLTPGAAESLDSSGL